MPKVVLTAFKKTAAFDAAKPVKEHNKEANKEEERLARAFIAKHDSFTAEQLADVPEFKAVVESKKTKTGTPYNAARHYMKEFKDAGQIEEDVAATSAAAASYKAEKEAAAAARKKAAAAVKAAAAAEKAAAAAAAAAAGASEASIAATAAHAVRRGADGSRIQRRSDEAAALGAATTGLANRSPAVMAALARVGEAAGARAAGSKRGRE
jgi:colicin import membrane protein